MTDFTVPIYVGELIGLDRAAEAIRIGVPLPRGLVHDSSEVVIVTASGRSVPHQLTPLSRWPDRSVKWLLVDAIVALSAGERRELALKPGRVEPSEACEWPQLRLTEDDGSITIETGRGRFQINREFAGPFTAMAVDDVSVLRAGGSSLRLVAGDGTVCRSGATRLSIEENGPIRASILAEGDFQDTPLSFACRAVFTAGTTVVRLEFLLRNTRAAAHPGGTWDLGDAGSFPIGDLTLGLKPAAPAPTVRWRSASLGDEHETDAERWCLYQDSSGGEQWDSPNHVDGASNPTVQFRGYRVSEGAAGRIVAEDHRATPLLTVAGGDNWLAASVKDFWQNFPKALRWQDGELGVSLFPREARTPVELQGGEQKRHIILLECGGAAERATLPGLQHPAAVHVDPQWIEASRAITWFAAASESDHRGYAAYIQQVVDGSRSFVQRREIIDEYGWRNFGELYADHEAVRHTGGTPFVSHYNNQYDFIYGAIVHYLRSGDPRWWRLADDAARHHIDIDIYHTQHDRPAFNGGLFWHTDHYLPAHTCTHRTYSRANGRPGAYGGGPSNEHNYTSGLLHYYFLTGDPEAAAAVRELADWVVAMDDGSATLFSVIDAGPTGAASKTTSGDYHGPGRGAGNSINALLDAYVLSGRRAYLAKAEALIQRCIHPRDDIGERQLDDPEHRWSYLVFLQVLGKYLAYKVEAGETDYAFQYARESLLHYASWVLEHEVPYKDVLHKVELPTETWPAHDIRKCHVLHLAASYSSGRQQAQFRARADYFFVRCLDDLRSFPTADLTRPLVILSVYGWLHDAFRGSGPAGCAYAVHNYDFGAPAAFVPQRDRLRASASRTREVVTRELTRLGRSAADRLRSKIRRSR